MINPKIGPEPSLRQRYRRYKQYSVCHDGRDYTFTVDGSGILKVCHSRFKHFKGKNFRKFQEYCKEKNKEVTLIADEEKEIWNL